MRLVGKLNYVTLTRPFDVAHLVSIVNELTSDPQTSHWHSIIRVLWCLKSAPERDLLYSDCRWLDSFWVDDTVTSSLHLIGDIVCFLERTLGLWRRLECYVEFEYQAWLYRLWTQMDTTSLWAKLYIILSFATIVIIKRLYLHPIWCFIEYWKHQGLLLPLFKRR